MEVANRLAPQGALVKALLILGAEDMGARNIPTMTRVGVGSILSIHLFQIVMKVFCR